MKMKYLLAFALFFLCLRLTAADYLIEAENFAQKGGWAVDQQFMDQMGSPYLIAHGMGTPVSDASTSLTVTEKGTYHIFVRTYNWTSPWSEDEGPGAFKVKVNGKTLKTVLGTKGDTWEWQYAGTASMKTGENSMTLVDMKGFDGRCDAIFLTTEPDPVLPTDIRSLDTFRRTHGTLPTSPSDGGHFDLVVVGGGIGGMCTAVSAARLGVKVALVNDRPVLGGNNSAEIRVHLGGGIEFGDYPALGRLIREFGHDAAGNAEVAEAYQDERKELFVASEPNIQLFSSYRAVRVQKEGADIHSVVIRHVEQGTELVLTAPLFCDCTGDGNLGVMAGADYLMGRESRAEYGESLAPETGDKLTMGSSVQWYSVESEKNSFPEFNYGMNFTEESCEKVKMGEWTWETGMNFDQITDFERIRDYGMLVIYANWSFLKNHFSGKADYAHRRLGWVAYVAGKRESRRLLGDYVLKQDDVDKHVFHEDASFPINWHFDLHFPEPSNSQYFPEREFKAVTKENPIVCYNVPYRCLYSRNVNNLFMAGRDISTTHVTLGSTRLMRNIGMMGEVVGMAASICKEHGARPRDVYQYYLPELKSLMQVGVGKSADTLPDNQKFNEGGYIYDRKSIKRLNEN